MCLAEDGEVSGEMRQTPFDLVEFTTDRREFVPYRTELTHDGFARIMTGRGTRQTTELANGGAAQIVVAAASPLHDFGNSGADFYGRIAPLRRQLVPKPRYAHTAAVDATRDAQNLSHTDRWNLLHRPYNPLTHAELCRPRMHMRRRGRYGPIIGHSIRFLRDPRSDGVARAATIRLVKSLARKPFSVRHPTASEGTGRSSNRQIAQIAKRLFETSLDANDQQWA